MYRAHEPFQVAFLCPKGHSWDMLSICYSRSSALIIVSHQNSPVEFPETEELNGTQPPVVSHSKVTSTMHFEYLTCM